MSSFTIHPDKFNFKDKNGALALYQFGTNVAKHYFCKKCGIYPFHETMKTPGHYRVNLGCIDEIDTNALSVDVYDGKNI